VQFHLGLRITPMVRAELGIPPLETAAAVA
jgi:hypothetical protein